MKRSTTMAAFAAAAITIGVLVTGCGGGNDSTPANRSINVQGIWSGTYTDSVQSKQVSHTSTNRIVGSSSVFLQFVQTGTTLTGTAEVSASGAVGSGSLTGTITGSSATTAIDYGAGGVVNSTFSLSGNTLSGTFVRTLNGTTLDSGSVTLTKSSITTTVNAAAIYNGTSLNDASGSTAKTLNFTVVQTGNSLALTGTSGSRAFSGSGTIVGNTMMAKVTQTGTTDETDITGTLNGSTVTGTTYQPGTDSGNGGVVQTGTFTVSSGT